MGDLNVDAFIEIALGAVLWQIRSSRLSFSLRVRLHEKTNLIGTLDAFDLDLGKSGFRHSLVTRFTNKGQLIFKSRCHRQGLIELFF